MTSKDSVPFDGETRGRGTFRVMPASAILKPDTTVIREYIDLLSSRDDYSQAIRIFSEIDRDVLDEMKVLVRTCREWEMPVKRKLSSLFKWEVNPESFERTLRHWLTVAPYANAGHSATDGFSREKIVRHAYNVQSLWPLDADWSEDMEVKARGCAVAACIVVDQQQLTASLNPEDALWLGVHADAVMQLLPVLRERQWFKPGLIEPILENKANALAAGNL